jgi:hypothetical protein
MDSEKVIDVNTGGAKDEVLKRRFGVIKDIVVGSTIAQLQEVRTWQVAAGVGLWQGLKYKGNLGQGLKAGVATVVVMAGVNAVSNAIKNIDDIKNA